MSSMNVSRHVRFGLPQLLHPPSGVQSITRLAGLDVGRRSTCPMNLLCLVATMPCRSPTPALSRSSSFVINNDYMYKMLCKISLLVDVFIWSWVLRQSDVTYERTLHWEWVKIKHVSVGVHFCRSCAHVNTGFLSIHHYGY